MFRVKPLRLANFRSILEELGDASASGDASPPSNDRERPMGEAESRDRLRSLLSSVGRASWNFVSPRRLSRLYAEARPDLPSEPQQEASETEIVAGQLHLRPRMGARELRRIRRDFARRNHPDQVPPAFRKCATERMIIANGLIDEALRACGPDA